jgi:hypothetical protein
MLHVKDGMKLYTKLYKLEGKDNLGDLGLNGLVWILYLNQHQAVRI